VSKGQELGRFSSVARRSRWFQSGAVDRFTVAAPDYPQPPAIQVNAQIAVAS